MAIKGKHFLNLFASKSIKVIVPVFVLLLIVFWQWLLPGPRVANDLPLVSHESLLNQFDIPRAWQDRGAEGLGEYTVFTLWSWPVTFLSGLLAKLGTSFALQERLLLLFPTIFLGTFGIYKILSDYKLSRPAIFTAAILYLTNTYVVLLIDGGQLSVALTYAFFPLVFYLVKNSIYKSIKGKIVAGVSLSILGFLDIRFVYVLFLLLAAYFLYELIFIQKDKFNYFKNLVTSGLVSGFILVALHFYWILPIIKYPLSDDTVGALTASSGLNFTELKHAFLLLSPHWYKNVFGHVTPVRLEFVLVPVLAFAAPICALSKKNKNLKTIYFWALVAIFSVFLAKGGNTPLPMVYPWLYGNIPGFSLFRDSTKFFFLIALPYSVLTAFTVDFVVRKFKKVRLIFPILFTTCYILLISPVWLGKMTGTFARPVNENEFKVLSEIIKNDNNFGRVLWIGSKAPLGYSSPQHPAVESGRLSAIRPFAIGTVGTYETLNYLRESNYMGDLLGVANVSYIVDPFPDTRREELKRDNIDYYYAFWEQLSNREWISEKISDPPVASLKVSGSSDRATLAGNTYLVVGSDGIYEELVNVETFRMQDNALIFVEERGVQSNEVSNGKYLVYGKNVNDLSVNFIPNKSYISAIDNLEMSPNETGWWRRGASDIVWLRDFYHHKYGIENIDFDFGMGWAISEGENTLSIGSDQLSEGKVLLARVMASSSGGEVLFFQAGEAVGSVNTYVSNPEVYTQHLEGHNEIPDMEFEYNRANFNWYEVGVLSSSEPLEVTTKGDINVLNTLIAVSPTEWSRALEEAQDVEAISWQELTEEERIELFLGESSTQVSYERLSPTQYKVSVAGVTKPTTLVFSESYDSLWELDGQSAFPVYSFLNGFTVYENGEYDLYFSAQKYVEWGFVVSAFSFAALMGLLLYNFISGKNTGNN
jgi:hypothetical protein